MYIRTQIKLVAGAVQEELQSYPAHRLYGHRNGRRVAELKTTLVGLLYTKKAYFKLNTKYWLQVLFKNKCNPVELTDCTVTVGAVDEWLNSLSSVSRAIEHEQTQGTAHKDGDSATQALATQGTQVCFSLLAMAASASFYA